MRCGAWVVRCLAAPSGAREARWRGMARRGAWRAQLWCGVERRGAVRCGTLRCGAARHGSDLLGAARRARGAVRGAAMG